MATLGELVQDTRKDLQEFQNLTQSTLFFNDEALKMWIGRAFKFYANKMIDKGEGYFETTIDLSITANQETVSISGLVPPFKSISNLYKRTTTGIEPLRRNEIRYQGVSNIGVGAGDSYIPFYNLRGLNIVLYPTPRASESAGPNSGLKLDYNYVPTFPNANSADGFTFNEDFNVIYEPMITLHAAISALEAKDGMGGVSDIGSFKSRLRDWEDDFYNSLKSDETPEEVTYYGDNYANPFTWESY